MKRTGIFFHHQEGERLRDFPQALAGILDRDNVFLFDAFYPLKPPSSFELQPIPEETLSWGPYAPDGQAGEGDGSLSGSTVLSRRHCGRGIENMARRDRQRLRLHRV
jgi:hypothetical protein